MSKFFTVEQLEPTIREVVDSGGEFEIYPRGTSMLPLIHQERDSVILVKPPDALSVGDMALYKRDGGQFVLHRVMEVQQGSYTMCGDNQTTLERGILHRQIIAVVSGMNINGRSVSITDGKYLRYVRRRENMLYRRLALGVRHFPSSLKRRLKIGDRQNPQK